ncbi:hypothetical protein SUGI_0597110 [Cryptomeria japonica]|nr:hypothetical protein SUGI_0597110 [Cryptomeria japonica]
MMNNFIRSGVGILGSAFSLFMYSAPICTFRSVMLNKTSGEMLGLTYAVGLFNYLVYAWYGSPLISNGWDNALVLTINTIGLLLQCCFCTIYLLFSLPKSKKKLVVGSIGMVASVILYGSPLSDIVTT